jgi:hypothetical protein
VQHPFQLCSQKSSLYTYDPLARNAGGSKKKDVLLPFVSVNALLFFMQYGYVSFPCVLQLETIS